jgi:hypothetical protein
MNTSMWISNLLNSPFNIIIIIIIILILFITTITIY